MKTELVYVTDNDVDEYESSEVKVVGKNRYIKYCGNALRNQPKAKSLV